MKFRLCLAALAVILIGMGIVPEALVYGQSTGTLTETVNQRNTIGVLTATPSTGLTADALRSQCFFGRVAHDYGGVTVPPSRKFGDSGSGGNVQLFAGAGNGLAARNADALGDVQTGKRELQGCDGVCDADRDAAEWRHLYCVAEHTRKPRRSERVARASERFGGDAGSGSAGVDAGGRFLWRDQAELHNPDRSTVYFCSQCDFAWRRS